MLLFHGGFAWAKGGYLGVSLFFTLSGFLISRLLMAEHDRSGEVRLSRFWVRRAHRLWPASLLTLLFFMFLARFAFNAEEVAGLRCDLLASVAQVTNWRFIIDGRSYGDLFASPSLVQHFWSLAIEEQMYLLLPLVLVVALRMRHRLAVPAVVGGLMLTSVLATVLVQGDGVVDRVYYGTDTRAFELLAGVMLAVVGRHAPRLAHLKGQGVQVVGWVAAGLSLLAWATVAQDQPILSRGGLWLYAAVSVALIVGVRAPGPLGQALSWKPLEQLGRISYGVYLLHWPIFQWLSPQRLGVGQVAAFVIGTAVTVSAAALSYSLLEQPIRSGRAGWLGTTPRPSMIAGAAFAVVLLAIPTIAPAGRVAIDFDAAQDELDGLRANDPGAATGTPKVGFFGDSTGLPVTIGMSTWAEQEGFGQMGWEHGWVQFGCGLITEGTREANGRRGPVRPVCRERDTKIAESAPGLDLAVWMAGAWDVMGYELPGEDGFRDIEDPEFREVLMDQAEQVYELMTSGGARFAWVLIPDLEAGWKGGQPPTQALPESRPERVALYNGLGEQLADEHDDVVLIDLRSWMQSQPGGMLDREWRPDRIHFTTETAEQLARQFMGQAVVDVLP
ncbi:acyltransferase family protein [soil metagenome]